MNIVSRTFFSVNIFILSLKYFLMTIIVVIKNILFSLQLKIFGEYKSLIFNNNYYHKK